MIGTTVQIGGGASRGKYFRDASGKAVWSPTGVAPTAAAAATAAATTSTAAETGLLRSSAADILGLKSQAVTDEANAKAEDISAEGYTREATAYGRVGDIADENMGIAGVSGEIKRLQEARRASRTIGSQKAAVASAGFGASGSSLDLLRSSFQEGMLSDQLIRTQTSLTQGGYLAESAAADVSVAGAEMASASSLELAKKHRAAGSLATATAASQTDALTAYITSTQGGAALTAAQQLALSTLDGSFSNESLGLSLSSAAEAEATATASPVAGPVDPQEVQARRIADQIKAGGAKPVWTGIGPGVDFTYMKYL